MSRRELTQEQINDAKRLKAAVLGSKLSQQEVGDRMGIGQSGVNHFVAGTRALNIEAAIKFSNILKVPVGDFSPSLQGIIDSAYIKPGDLRDDLFGLSSLEPESRAEIISAIKLLINGVVKS